MTTTMRKLRVITGHNRTGLFSVATVLLENMVIAGEYDYALQLGREYLYYDQNKGENVWEYYFGQPKRESEDLNRYTTDYGFLFDRTGVLDIGNRTTSYFEAIEKASLVFRNSIGFAPGIGTELEQQKLALGLDKKYYAVHKRETDFKLHATRIIDSEYFFRRIEETLGDEKIFLATDSQKAFWNFKLRYGKRLIASKIKRSKDSTGLHFHQFPKGENWLNGYNALLDCYLLSEGSKLFRTRSNLTTFSLILNPYLENVEMDESVAIS